MAKIETLFNSHETKPQQNTELNKDYIVTLDIENKNRGFRDSASRIKTFWENSKAVFSNPDVEERNKDYITTLDLENRNNGFRESESGWKNFVGNSKVVVGGWKEKFKLKGMFKWELAGEAGKLVVGLSEKANEQAEKAKEGDELAKQREEFEKAKNAFVEYANSKTPEQAFVEYANEFPKEKKELYTKVADMIYTAGPNVKGGYGDVVEGLDKGELTNNLKKQTVEVINILLKDHKWRGDNLKALEELKTQFTQETKDSSGGEVLEALEREKSYGDFGKLLMEYKPLTGDNKEFAHELTQREKPSKKVLEKGLEAVKKMYQMTAHWPEETMKTLKETETFLKKDLGI
jgi:hypothetical protein